MVEIVLCLLGLQERKKCFFAELGTCPKNIKEKVQGWKESLKEPVCKTQNVCEKKKMEITRIANVGSNFV